MIIFSFEGEDDYTRMNEPNFNVYNWYLGEACSFN